MKRRRTDQIIDAAACGECIPPDEMEAVFNAIRDQAIRDCIAALREAEDARGRVYDPTVNLYTTASGFLERRFPEMPKNVSTQEDGK